jgi:hypothetical protein
MPSGLAVRVVRTSEPPLVDASDYFLDPFAKAFRTLEPNEQPTFDVSAVRRTATWDEAG